jgi:iron complex outermembrane receptor protein
MMQEKMLSRSLRLMFTGVAAGLLAQPVLAQQAPADSVIQRVEITGSSIKRIAKEGALPVQTLSRKDIEQSGATNVADLVAALPAMQGFITASTSVNGGGGGVQTASVHAIGSAYTLVLLNGRRMAPYGTGSAVNLGSIPLSAVERVEILTDGASTLYGSDAIAGVVNFILKKNQTDLNVEVTANKPHKKGGESANFAISKGFGTLEQDGYNVMFAYSHDQAKALEAAQRDFANSGVHRFSNAGKQFATWQTSINSIPANADVYDSLGNNATFSPDLVTSGKCNGAHTFVRGSVCRYDYASTVQLVPELKRDSFFASGNMKLSSETTLFGEFVASRFSNTARYAAPAQPLTTISTDPVSGAKTVSPVYVGAYNKSVVPLLPGQGINPADVTDAFFYFRALDAGGRADDFKTDARHLALGFDSAYAGWDVNGSFVHSENTQKDDAVSGYMSANAFEGLVKSGAYNPYIMNPNAASILAPAVLHSNLGTTKSKIDVLSAHASREVFSLPGGAAAFGAGIDFTKQHFSDQPSELAQGPGPQHPAFTDTIIGGGVGSQALEASRKNWGTFGELQMPLTKQLDVTAAVRYDSYAAVNKENTSYDVDGNPAKPGKQGVDVSKATYKLSGRFQPSKQVMLRASYGTGFKAPTMNNISDPLKNAGSSNSFPCPISAPADPRTPYCRGVSEYGLLSKGNPSTGADALKPEESKQAAFGIRLEPIDALSLGIDFWDVKLTNQIQSLSQKQLFTNQDLANKFISIYYDPIQKSKVLVATQSPLNLASSHFRGIDLDATFRTATPIGKLSANWSGTYMLKAQQDVPGTGLESSVGRFDSYDNVTFRVISRMVFALKSTDALTNSLTLNYRSGYHDKAASADDGIVRAINADGSIGSSVDMVRDVRPYTTLDWQGKYNVNKNLAMTAGIRNLLDRDPPFTIRDSGGGNQVGYDGRYTDPLGRTFYVTAQYKF